VPISTNGAPRYKWRRLIENFFDKLKEFKRIALRADKTDSFSAIVHLVAALIKTRARRFPPTWEARRAPRRA
jgi:hypothetical protein